MSYLSCVIVCNRSECTEVLRVGPKGYDRTMANLFALTQAWAVFAPSFVTDAGHKHYCEAHAKHVQGDDTGIAGIDSGDAT